MLSLTWAVRLKKNYTWGYQGYGWRVQLHMVRKIIGFWQKHLLSRKFFFLPFLPPPSTSNVRDMIGLIWVKNILKSFHSYIDNEMVWCCIWAHDHPVISFRKKRKALQKKKKWSNLWKDSSNLLVLRVSSRRAEQHHFSDQIRRPTLLQEGMTQKHMNRRPNLTARA